MKTEVAATRFLSNLPTLRRHRRVAARRARLQSPARPALYGRVSCCSVEKINYPGMGNSSLFVLDAFGKNVGILEYSANSLASTKQFVLCGMARCEARSSSGTVTKQFFMQGETNGGASAFYALDHLGSIREMTDTSGSVQSQYSYDPYGGATKLEGTLAAEFQYAGYYMHLPSGLNLTTFRNYSASSGRWIGRDPIGESGGINLYAYVGNSTVANRDPSGLYPAAGTYSNSPAFTSTLPPGPNGASAQTYFYYGCVGICSYYSGSPNPTNPTEGASKVKCFKTPGESAQENCECEETRYELFANGDWVGGKEPTPGADGSVPFSIVLNGHFNFVAFLPGGIYAGGNHAQYRNNRNGHGVSPYPGATVTYTPEFTDVSNGPGLANLWCVLCR